MPTKRVTMRKLRDVLRLKLQADLSVRAISRSTKLSIGGVQKLLSRARALHLTWPLPDDLDDARAGRVVSTPAPIPGAGPRAVRRRTGPRCTRN